MARGKKKQPPYLLLVLIPLLLAGIAAFVLDQQARSAASEAKGRIDALLANLDTASRPEDVRRVVGRAPEEALAAWNNRLRERYVWSGALQTYFVEVVYLPGENPELDGVWLNQAPE